jgi:hypothetical protein
MCFGLMNKHVIIGLNTIKNNKCVGPTTEKPTGFELMKPGHAGMNKTAGVTWLCGLKHRFVLIF